MSWLQSKLQTVFSVLMREGGSPHSGVSDRLDEIRECMVEALGPHAGEYSYLSRRIDCAPDVQVLWYLRGELMAALAAKIGESAADQLLEPISAMFSGLLPRALGARYSPLKNLERSRRSEW
jgi:hypothetical protein